MTDKLSISEMSQLDQSEAAIDLAIRQWSNDLPAFEAVAKSKGVTVRELALSVGVPEIFLNIVCP